MIGCVSIAGTTTLPHAGISSICRLKKCSKNLVKKYKNIKNSKRGSGKACEIVGNKSGKKVIKRVVKNRTQGSINKKAAKHVNKAVKQVVKKVVIQKEIEKL